MADARDIGMAESLRDWWWPGLTRGWLKRFVFKRGKNGWLLKCSLLKIVERTDSQAGRHCNWNTVKLTSQTTQIRSFYRSNRPVNNHIEPSICWKTPLASCDLNFPRAKPETLPLKRQVPPSQEDTNVLPIMMLFYESTSKRRALPSESFMKMQHQQRGAAPDGRRQHPKMQNKDLVKTN